MSAATLSIDDYSLVHAVNSESSFMDALRRSIDECMRTFSPVSGVKLLDDSITYTEVDDSVRTIDVDPATDTLLHAAIDEIAEEAINELAEYETLPYGWDGYGGSTFEPALVSVAQLLVIYISDNLKSRATVPSEITPGPISDGSINIEVSTDHTYAIITLLPNLEAIHFYREYNGQVEDDTEFKPVLQLLGEKLESLFNA